MEKISSSLSASSAVQCVSHPSHIHMFISVCCHSIMMTALAQHASQHTMCQWDAWQVSNWYCWGTTHFCDECHNKQGTPQVFLSSWLCCALPSFLQLCPSLPKLLHILDPLDLDPLDTSSIHCNSPDNLADHSCDLFCTRLRLERRNQI